MERHPRLEGLYQVSDDGHAKSLERVVVRSSGSPLTVAERIMCPQPDYKGYMRLRLSRPGLGVTGKVHRLVTLAFVGPCPDGMEVCHNNGRKTDNRLENLRYDTSSASGLDKIRHGTDHNVRRTHCRHDHPFSPQNTRIDSRGHRICRACQRRYTREYELRRRAATMDEGGMTASGRMWVEIEVDKESPGPLVIVGDEPRRRGRRPEPVDEGENDFTQRYCAPPRACTAQIRSSRRPSHRV